MSTEYLSRGQLTALVRRSLKYAFEPRPELRIVREAPPSPPLVSVIIPTYNRSNVLRFAIHSVLWQSEENFELLVIGDGCTDDSEPVVRSFGDARIQWHNLPANTGHQSAPVNAGLSMARGRYIANLGHDDIWHPLHLRTMLAALRSAPGDVAVSLVEMMGPKHTNYRVLAGVHPEGSYDPVKCSPPSGLMFAREVYEKVGPWPHYRTVWRNPECEFQYRAYLAGFRFVPTRELTVYKFNSTLWKNSYFEKPYQEQQNYLTRIQTSRWFQLKEALAIANVHVRRLEMQSPVLPEPPTPDTPGWYVTQYRKLRGLE